MNSVWVDKSDLEPEEAAVRLLVDQLDSLRGEPFQLAPKIADLVGHVMHSGPAAGKELANGRLLAERCEQLDATLADAHRSRFDTLLDNRVAMLDLGAEEAPIRVDRVVEILNGDSDMMNPLRVHARGS